MFKHDEKKEETIPFKFCSNESRLGTKNAYFKQTLNRSTQ